MFFQWCFKSTPVSLSSERFFLDVPPPTGQWGARRSTGGYNTRHDMFAPWAVINEDLLYAHALAKDHARYGTDWYWLERH